MTPKKLCRSATALACLIALAAACGGSSPGQPTKGQSGPSGTVTPTPNRTALSRSGGPLSRHIVIFKHRKPIHNSGSTRDCGDTPAPGLSYWNVTSCWQLDYGVIHGVVYDYFLFAGNEPDHPTVGAIVYFPENERFTVAPTPRRGLRPVIRAVHPPYVCVGYKHARYVDVLNLATGAYTHRTDTGC